MSGQYVLLTTLSAWSERKRERTAAKNLFWYEENCKSKNN